MLFHLSINAGEPARVARLLADLLGGEAMAFPPFPDSWIAFSEADDGTAIEVYPLTHRLRAGRAIVACDIGKADASASFVHAAIASPLSAAAIIERGAREDWPARRCDRGPFECIEIWLENRLLVEVLDPAMQRDYRSGMTMANWRAMFGI